MWTVMTASARQAPLSSKLCRPIAVNQVARNVTRERRPIDWLFALKA